MSKIDFNMGVKFSDTYSAGVTSFPNNSLFLRQKLQIPLAKHASINQAFF